MERLFSRCIFLALSCAVLLSQSALSSDDNSELVKSTLPYRTVDGHKVLADIYRPNNDDECPVIVWIHGGALIMGNREFIPDQIRSLAEEKGYALVSIDYRLAPETQLTEIISDIEAAFKWLAKDAAKPFRLKVDRIVVCGGSAGGYLTLVTGYRVQPRPTALVSFFGYGDLVGEWYSKPSPHPAHNPRVITEKVAGRQTDGTVISDASKRIGNGALIYLNYRQNGTWPQNVSGFHPVKEAHMYVPFEPVRNVTKNYPPTLLIHGTKDTDVPFEQSTMMVDEFKKHGVKYVMHSIENGEHGLAGGKKEQIDNAYKSMKEFIIKHLEK